jgi:hypothetical protein
VSVVRRLLGSPRRRRRMLRGGTAALGLAALVFVMAHWSNTAKPEPEVFSNEPSQVDPLPVRAPFAKAKREGVLHTAAQFLRTAVVRENVAASWELTAPTLKQGYTRKTWATQDIPVQPYPVDSARWKVDYSWVDTVGLKAALFPKKGHEDVPAAVFDMELTAYGKGRNRHWLVDSWTPSSYTGIPAGPLGSSRRPVVQYIDKPRLESHWLLAPFVVFGLALLIPIGLGVRGWWRGRRAVRRYEAGLR